LQLKHPDGRRVTLPIHAGKDIKRGTLGGILKDIRLTKEDFIEAMRS
jgi:predicted RNA binding protein YcfA (HicA-like mRNA interferase family)